MIRFFDFIFALCGLLLSSPLLIIIVIVGLFDTGSPLFIQTRVGKYQRPFKLIKFRTMATNTASVASHLVDKSATTRLGRWLRKTKLDELPQLINVLKGEMSLVGPRPNLFNQTELITQREKLGVYQVLPGITGLAQIRNIDMSTPELLAKTDQQMIATLSIASYLNYIFLTVKGHGQGDAARK